MTECTYCIVLCFCHILSIVVRYGATRMLNLVKPNIRCITVLQKRIVRLVCGAKCLEHTSTLFKQLRILKFVDVVKFKTAIIMYQAYHNVLPNKIV